MIYTNISIQEAYALPEPKKMILNDNTATVYTEGDIPIEEIVVEVVPDYLFRDRFTDVEMTAILNLAYRDLDVNAMKGLLLLQTASGGVPLNRTDVNQLLDYFTFVGVLAPGRKAEILS